MTRSLFVLRHGKAGWGASGDDDHERSLEPRGRADAARMGRFLTAAGQEPELVLASSAVRARTSAEFAHEAGGWTCPLEVVGELYGASPEGVMDQVRGLDGSLERVLVVGHEPTCSHVVGHLTGGPPPVFPTAALARVDLDVEGWGLVAPARGRLAWLVPPRALGDR